MLIHIHTPDIDAWANGMLDLMSEEKEFSELKSENKQLNPRPKEVASNDSPRDVAPKDVVPLSVVPPLPINALFTTSCVSSERKALYSLWFMSSIIPNREPIEDETSDDGRTCGKPT
jgi:hypothetical protein